jgi:mono/diheme cytochrome c family protein
MKASTILILNLLVSMLYLPTKAMSFQDLPICVENLVSPGKALFEQHCSKCHGNEGSKGRFGAKNLQQSSLTNEQYFRVIQKGKGIMPSWEKKLSPDQIFDIISYIKKLKE